MTPASHSTVKSDSHSDNTAAVTTLVSVHRGQTQFPPKFILILVLGTLLFSLFAGLGTWQLQRRQWKHQLIARVEQRIHAPPVAPPTQERWPSITAASDEYRHVRITGTLLLHMTTRVQAVTELGSGFWLMTPLRCADGSIILINRGFVPAKPEDYHLPALTSASAAPAPSLSTITGLLRLSEPHGGFLRTNDPANQRWFSRDVGAIAAAHNLVQAAPYFIDAEATTAPKTTDSASPADHPIGGLTVIHFNDSHMVYTLTWYVLALMVAGACYRLVREQRKLQQRNIDAGINGSDEESIHEKSD